MNLALTALLPHVTAFGLLLLRCGALFAMVPTLGGESVPLRVRGALAAMVSLVLVATSGPVTLGEPLALLLAGIGEVLLGAAMGLVARLLLVAAEMAGELVGMSMGLSFMQIVDPLTQETSEGAARLFGAFAVLIFLAADGHHALIWGLGESLQEAPLGTVLPRAQLAATLLPLLSTVVAAASRIAAPVVVALLLTNGALALLARAAPQLNLFGLSFAVTVALGLVVLLSSFSPSLAALVSELRRLPDQLSATISSGGSGQADRSQNRGLHVR